MRVILFGATGMIGQGVLRECLLDSRVSRVLSIGRAASGKKHEKLEDLVVADLYDYSAVAAKLSGYDACFFCLGITSAGMSEAEYTRITFDLSLAAASALVRANPRMRMCFISGAGADSSERGRTMWARVKGRAENALLAMPFEQVTIFRPGIIQPLHGIRSRTFSYRLLYAVLSPLIPVVHALAPGQITTTERIGRAMLQVARVGSAKRVLTNADINAAAAAYEAPS
jgi:uncharacterized protein YbjT (DUF2867 family)